MVRCQSASAFFNYCVRQQVERKGGMSDVGVSPLVQAPALIQDMGTVHDSTWAEVSERRFWRSSD